MSSYNKRKDIEEELNKIHDDYLGTMKKVEAQREDIVWKDYIFYVNEKIADGIIDIILFNLNKLYDSL